ncbi:MAG: hypothetical protein ACP5H8_02225 [Candidatus Micrarchaeia archaeon]
MKIISRKELGPYLTFQPDKKRPIFNWFYYKEAFSSRFVSTILREFDVNGPVLDPFVGVGTVPLECKYEGIISIGRDMSPLAVLASKVKCRNYDREFARGVLSIAESICSAEKVESKMVPWRFELFPPERIFPRRNYEFMAKAREHIKSVKDEKMREFLMLALVSIIPQSSYVLKDGGVLKVMKDKHAGDARKLFMKKIKRMVRDVEQYGVEHDEPDIMIGSATSLDIADGTIDCIITSPPYLNNVDYTKVYGIELGIAFPDIDIKTLRMNMLRSFLKRDSSIRIEDDYVYGILLKHIGHNPPLLAYAYFTDMIKVLSECKRVLRKGGVCAFVVGNAVVERANIECDKIIAEMWGDMGMEAEVWVGSVRIADVNVIGKQRVRESCIILRK